MTMRSTSAADDPEQNRGPPRRDDAEDAEDRFEPSLFTEFAARPPQRSDGQDDVRAAFLATNLLLLYALNVARLSAPVVNDANRPAPQAIAVERRGDNE